MNEPAETTSRIRIEHQISQNVSNSPQPILLLDRNGLGDNTRNNRNSHTTELMRPVIHRQSIEQDEILLDNLQ